jgi:hypothetical protein
MIRINILKAEWIKNKSLFSFWVILFYPVFVVLLIGSSYFFGDSKHFKSSIWGEFFEDLFSTWTLLFLPIYCLITAYSVFSVENYTNNWRNLFILGIDRKIVINHKFILVLLYNLIGNTVLILSAILSMVILKISRPSIPLQIDLFNPSFPKILFLFFITSLAMIYIFSMIIIWIKSIILPFIIGVVMSFLNLFIAIKKVSIFYPISYPCTVYNKFLLNEKITIFFYISSMLFLTGIVVLNLLINRCFNINKL